MMMIIIFGLAIALVFALILLVFWDDIDE